MAPASTARPYDDLDLWPMVDVASAIVAGQAAAVQAVAAAAPALARAIDALAGRMRAGGRMAYAGAGSSGTVAQMDALELPGTYGIPLDRVPVILAGGLDSLHALDGGAEDDGEAAASAVDALGLGAQDGLIAVTASGSTPFTVAALARARARGAVTVGVACRPGSPLLAACDHPVLIEVPGEVIGGSTRMAAGTAQKCALNILSTGVALRLGHAYRGLMVNMNADNAKLRARAVGIVAEAARTTEDAAAAALAAADWSIKTAVALCAGASGPAEARVRLAQTGGDLRAALREGAARPPHPSIGAQRPTGGKR